MKHLFKLTSLAFIEVILIVLIFAEFYHIGKVGHATTSEIPIAYAIQNSIIFSIFKLLILLYIGTLVGIYAIIEYKNHKLSNKAQKVVLREFMEFIKNEAGSKKQEESNDQRKEYSIKPLDNRQKAVAKIFYEDEDIEARETYSIVKPLQKYFNDYGKVGDNLKACREYESYLRTEFIENDDCSLSITKEILKAFIIINRESFSNGSAPYVGTIESDGLRFLDDCASISGGLDMHNKKEGIDYETLKVVVALGRKFIINP